MLPARSISTLSPFRTGHSGGPATTVDEFKPMVWPSAWSSRAMTPRNPPFRSCILAELRRCNLHRSEFRLDMPHFGRYFAIRGRLTGHSHCIRHAAIRIERMFMELVSDRVRGISIEDPEQMCSR